MKWDYDYLHDLPCTATRTTSCVRGFNAFVGDPASRSVSVFVPNSFDAKGQVVSKGISTAVNFERYGNVQFCTTAVSVNAKCAAVESMPTCVSKFVWPFVTPKMTEQAHRHRALIAVRGSQRAGNPPSARLVSSRDSGSVLSQEFSH